MKKKKYGKKIMERLSVFRYLIIHIFMYFYELLSGYLTATLCHFWQPHREPCKEARSLSLTEQRSGFEVGSFRFFSKALSLWVTLWRLELNRFIHLKLNPLLRNVEKWSDILLKILRCKHRKFFKVCLAIFQHYEIND